MRYEYKYLVSDAQLPLLRQMVLPFLDLDSYARVSPAGEYTVRSIYFETPDFEFYEEKVSGIPNRKKLRIRGYNEQEEKSKVFLEIKRKYQIPMHKYRAPLLFEDAKQLFRGSTIHAHVHNSSQHPQATDHARRFFYHFYRQQLRPTVLVVYEREAYQAKIPTDNQLRITFDKNLRGAAYPTLDDLYSERETRPAMPGYFVLEVKFNETFPSWMLPIIDRLALHKQAVSKYIICVDSVDIRRYQSRYPTQLQARLFHRLHRSPKSEC